MSTHPTPTPGWTPQPLPEDHRRSRKVLIGLAAGVALTVAVFGGVAIGQAGEGTTAKQAPATAAPAPIPTDPEIAPEPDPSLEEEAPVVPETGQPGATAVISEDDGSGPEEAGTLTADQFTALSSVNSFGEREYPDHKWFVKAHIDAQASKSGFEVNPYDFYVRADDGARYEPGDGNAFALEVEPGLNDASLAKGEKLSGWIVFDLPAKHGTLVYAPSWGSESVFEWTF